jgi:hypothetical protein
MESDRSAKVHYYINSLPKLGLNFEQMMSLMGDSEEVEIFSTLSVKTLVDYKWNKYGKKMQLKSSIIHFVYVAIYFYYINNLFEN